LPPRAIHASRQISAYIGDLIEQRRNQPRDDLISRVLAARYEDPDHGSVALSPNEVLMFCNLLSAAGSETTQKLISNSLVALHEHREQWEHLCANPTLAPQAVDEGLRYDSPTHWIARTTTSDVDVAGTTIPAGDWVLLLLASANRDERQYVEPDDYIIERSRQQTVFFGQGRHVCLGQWLARREAGIVLEEIVHRFPDYRIGECERVLTATVRGYTRVEMELR
jgi:cytochrome P450